MNLTASLIVHNERSRYLEPVIEHLLEFCDQVCVVDDGSVDGTEEWLEQFFHVHVARTDPRFFIHEGNARQFLIEWTLAHEPTHVLSIDADELISDGGTLRARIEMEPDHPVWAVNMSEVWRADADGLWIRNDGGWRAHNLPLVWKAPPNGTRYTMLNRKLACRRVPEQVLTQGARARVTGVDCLHFGWARPGERKARYDRYATHDGGKFHAGSHLRSILWPDARVKLQWRDWPEGSVFDGLREGFMIPA